MHPQRRHFEQRLRSRPDLDLERHDLRLNLSLDLVKQQGEVHGRFALRSLTSGTYRVTFGFAAVFSSVTAWNTATMGIYVGEDRILACTANNSGTNSTRIIKQVCSGLIELATEQTITARIEGRHFSVATNGLYRPFVTLEELPNHIQTNKWD